MNIKNRIKEYREINADEVRPNPQNWRTHPQAQRDALRGVLADVGIAAPVLAYESRRYGGLTLIDGHERMTVGVPFPAAILDVSDEEADLLLATFDPLGAMAETNAVALDTLMRQIETDSPAVSQMLADLAERAGVVTFDTSTLDPAAAFGALPDEDRAPFQQMTFTLHDDQVETIKAAIDAAKDAGAFEGTGNENSNGNALARICEAYLER